MNDEDRWESEEEEGEEIEDGENVQYAKSLTDPLTEVESCRHFPCKDGSEATIKYFAIKSLSNKLRKWTLDLMRRNMRSMYEQSSWGWKPKEKKEEMTEDEARFLIAFIDSKPVALSHFRFDMDFGREIVYCYEIQLEPSVRSLGLGKHIMTTLEMLASKFNLEKVVLTVFKHNLDGITFFRKIGYETDETSPEEDDNCYYILSKSILINDSKTGTHA